MTKPKSGPNLLERFGLAIEPILERMKGVGLDAAKKVSSLRAKKAGKP